MRPDPRRDIKVYQNHAFIGAEAAGLPSPTALAVTVLVSGLAASDLPAAVVGARGLLAAQLRGMTRARARPLRVTAARRAPRVLLSPSPPFISLSPLGLRVLPCPRPCLS